MRKGRGEERKTEERKKERGKKGHNIPVLS